MGPTKRVYYKQAKKHNSLDIITYLCQRLMIKEGCRESGIYKKGRQNFDLDPFLYAG